MVMASLPVVPFAPLHCPDAVQLLALLALQISEVLPPDDTLPGLATSVTLGAALPDGRGTMPHVGAAV